jgi:hypothetical protein
MPSRACPSLVQLTAGTRHQSQDGGVDVGLFEESL